MSKTARTSPPKRRYTEAGPIFCRELPYGTRLWIKEKGTSSNAPEEQALRLRGTAAEQRDEWLLQTDEILSSAELANTFLICLPEVRR